MSSKNNSLDKGSNFVAPLSEMEDIIKESIKDGGRFTMMTAGTSMKPLLRNRKDYVVLAKPEGQLKKYDIPLYKRPSGQYTLHRVMKVTENGYTMCGDNQLIFEKNVREDSVIAVVSKVIKNGKEIDLKTSKIYQFYVFLWCKCFFLRFVPLKIRAFLSRIRRFF